jgi:hypothetical protein
VSAPRRLVECEKCGLGCREGKPVWNLSGTCREEDAIWSSGSREPARQSGGIRRLVPSLIATAGLPRFTLSQRIGLGRAGQVRCRLSPRSARVRKTMGGDPVRSPPKNSCGSIVFPIQPLPARDLHAPENLSAAGACLRPLSRSGSAEARSFSAGASILLATPRRSFHWLRRSGLRALTRRMPAAA